VAIGHECMTSGLVAAMLGSKVIMVCERTLLQYVQQNVRMFRKETLDYTKFKSSTVAVLPGSPGRCSALQASLLCEQIEVPALDIVVLTEESLQCVAGECGSIMGSRRAEAAAKSFFDLLEELVPPRSATKILVICDRSREQLTEDPAKPPAEIEESLLTMPAWLQGDGLPPGLVLPPEWHARPFCQLPQSVPVLWLERTDAEIAKPRKPEMKPPRKPLPPMGASSARCGLGGSPQSSIFGRRIENKDWFVNNEKLKEALSLHNKWKQTEAETVLQEARAWASSGTALESEARQALDRNSSGSTAGETGQVKVSPFSRATVRGKGKLSRSDGFSKSSQKPPNSARLRPLTSTASKTRLLEEGVHPDGSQTAREPTIAERHASPPYWYQCNRPVYGSAGAP